MNGHRPPGQCAHDRLPNLQRGAPFRVHSLERSPIGQPADNGNLLRFHGHLRDGNAQRPN